MRNIKFRAWDTMNKCMCNVDLMNLYDEFYKFKCFGKDKSIAGIADFNDKSVILMQSTGLCDKNGVEIYEGDIVKNINTGSVGRVYWDVHNTGFSYNVKRQDQALFDSYAIFRAKFNLEIIGNIYENPELMEDKR